LVSPEKNDESEPVAAGMLGQPKPGLNSNYGAKNNKPCKSKAWRSRLMAGQGIVRYFVHDFLQELRALEKRCMKTGACWDRSKNSTTYNNLNTRPKLI
jgi:hypothetical protein